jgi:hypothetical protein
MYSFAFKKGLMGLLRHDVCLTLLAVCVSLALLALCVSHTDGPL